jgi:hypothetical protein
MANGAEPITIRDIDVPFWRIVVILIKWSIAAIPAAIIVAILYAVIFALLGGILAGVLEIAGVPIPEVPTPQAQ